MPVRTALTVSHNMLLGSVCALVQIAANLLSYPVFLHYLGYRQYGVWLTLAVVLNVVQFVSAGFSPALTQATAQSVSRGQREQIAQYVVWSGVGTICAGCGLLLLLPVVIGVTRAIPMDPAVLTGIVAIGPWLALLGAIALGAECTAALVAGAGRIHYVYIANALGQVLLLATSAALLAAGAGMASLVIGFGVARGIVLLMLGPMLYRALEGARLPMVPSSAILQGLLKSGGAMLAGTMLNVFLVPFNRWCIAAMAGPAAVPVFDIGYTGSMQIRNVLEFGLRSLVPEAASLASGERQQEVRRLHAIWARRVFYAGAILYGVAAVTAPLLLSAWLPGRLAPEQSSTFRLFLFAGFFSLLGTPAYYLLIGLRKLGDVFWSYVLQAAVNGGLMAAAVAWNAPRIVLFAAGAMSCATLASTVLLIVQLRKVRSADDGTHVKDPACCPV